MILPEITKFPVYIVSNWRTKSTILMTMIGEKYGLKFFCEPEEPHTLTSLEQLVKYDESKRNYVLKVHGQNLYKYPESIVRNFYVDGVYKINIRRRDRVYQIASSIIATSRNKWRYTIDDVSNHNEIKFSDRMIDDHINYINHNYQLIDKLHIKYDCTIYAEDIGDAEHHDNVKTPLPSNYKELLTAIRQKVENGN